jgi:hypothetical protein
MAKAGVIWLVSSGQIHPRLDQRVSTTIAGIADRQGPSPTSCTSASSSRRLGIYKSAREFMAFCLDSLPGWC